MSTDRTILNKISRAHAPHPRSPASSSPPFGNLVASGLSGPSGSEARLNIGTGFSKATEDRYASARLDTRAGFL